MEIIIVKSRKFLSLNDLIICYTNYKNKPQKNKQIECKKKEKMIVGKVSNSKTPLGDVIYIVIINQTRII